MNKIFLPSIVVFLAWAGAFVEAAEPDRYRYVREKGSDESVCQHMERVYNTHFVFPWARPLLKQSVKDPSYGPTSPFSFPKRPGVDHSSEMTLQMSYSRQPTSPEFDLIAWHEGRIAYDPPAGEGPALLAEFDIDNDGSRELVVKGGFMRTYYSGNGSGGEDMLFVLRMSEKDLPNPISWQSVFKNVKPAVITASPGVPFRLIRPFLYRGTTYLHGYEQSGTRERLRERIHIVKYVGGGNPIGPGERTPLQLERICVLRMMPK